jgi:hypothetical protein
MLSSNANHMKMVLAAMIESIFVVMGEPEEELRQCPLAMDKWRDLVIGPRQTVLGLIIDTNRLTVSIPLKYRTEVLALLESTWHQYRRRFKVSEAQEVNWQVGTLGRRCKLGISPLIPFVLIDRIRIIREQEAPIRDLSGIPRHDIHHASKQVCCHMQGSRSAHIICHETGS